MRPPDGVTTTPAPRDDRATRRRVLASAGVGMGLVLAGCTSRSAEPAFRPGDVDVDATETDPRSPAEAAAAASHAHQSVDENVTALAGLSIREHSFVPDGAFGGPTVEGVVEHDGDRLAIVEVRVRVYDDDDRQLGRYADRTGDLRADGTWRFSAIVLEAPGDVAGYDVGVLGLPT